MVRNSRSRIEDVFMKLMSLFAAMIALLMLWSIIRGLIDGTILLCRKGGGCHEVIMSDAPFEFVFGIVEHIFFVVLAGLAANLCFFGNGE